MDQNFLVAALALVTMMLAVSEGLAAIPSIRSNAIYQLVSDLLLSFKNVLSSKKDNG